MLIPSYRHVDATMLRPKMVLPFSFETAENGVEDTFAKLFTLEPSFKSVRIQALRAPLSCVRKRQISQFSAIVTVV